MIDKRKKYEVSIIRFVALILIICCHSCEWIGYTLGQSDKLGEIGNWCAVGVQIFLILSGYLYGAKADLFRHENRIDWLIRNFKKISLDYFVYLFLVIFPIYLHGISFREALSTIFSTVTFAGTIGGGTSPVVHTVHPVLLFANTFTL